MNKTTLFLLLGINLLSSNSNAKDFLKWKVLYHNGLLNDQKINLNIDKNYDGIIIEIVYGEPSSSTGDIAGIEQRSDMLQEMSKSIEKEFSGGCYIDTEISFSNTSQYPKQTFSVIGTIEKSSVEQSLEALPRYVKHLKFEINIRHYLDYAISLKIVNKSGYQLTKESIPTPIFPVFIDSNPLAANIEIDGKIIENKTPYIYNSSKEYFNLKVIKNGFQLAGFYVDKLEPYKIRSIPTIHLKKVHSNIEKYAFGTTVVTSTILWLILKNQNKPIKISTP